MKLGTHILSEVLNQTISIFLAQPTKKHFKELFRYAENLTWVVEQSILPLPTRHCPCPPIPSRTPILFRFFLFFFLICFFLFFFFPLPHPSLPRPPSPLSRISGGLAWYLKLFRGQKRRHSMFKSRSFVVVVVMAKIGKGCSL